MAKTKVATKTSPIETKSKIVTNSELQTNKEILKQFGEGILRKGKDLIDCPREVISVCPTIDVATGGGFQSGSLVAIAGQPRCGKTTTALHFAAKWQALGRKVLYLDAENRLRDRDLSGITGLNVEDIIVISSTRGKILSAQDSLTIVLSYLSQETDLLVIIDSISILAEEKEILGGITVETRGGAARLLARFCRLSTPVIPVNNHIVIMIAHVYANTSGYGKKTYTAMGSKGEYSLSTSLLATKIEPWCLGANEDKDQIGQYSSWKVERSPLGPPGQVAKSCIRYGIGIDETIEIINFAEDLALIEVSGHYYYWPSKDDAQVKGNGIEKFREAFIEKPECFAELRAKVMELIK